MEAITVPIKSRPRQRHPRFPMHVRVVRYDAQPTEWCSLNLSESGVFVSGEPFLDPGTELDVGLWLPAGPENVEVVGRARVVWTNHPDRPANSGAPFGMGMELIELDPDDHKLLQKRLYQEQQPAMAEALTESDGTDCLEVGVVIGSYRVLDLIGTGGMGDVYLAEHIQLGRQVALKRLHGRHNKNPVAVQRFFAEGKVVNKVRHPNVLEITDFISEGPDKCYVMELIQGQSLQDLLQNKIGLEFPRVMRIAIQVADALAAVHEAGIIHRDLKPGNILLVERRGSPDFVKLVDFGISKSQTLDADEWGSKTAPGMLIGSPGYMAPEQALGLDLDHRCDIYAFGVLLYQMVTGELLFHGNSWADVLVQHANRPPPPPSALRTDLPAQFEAIILSCLAKNKDERPNTAADLAEQLRLLRDVFWPEVSSMVQSSDCLPIPGLAPDHHGRSWHTNFVRLHKSASAAIGIGTAAFFLAFGVVLALALPAPRSGERGAAASFSEVLSRAAAAPVAALAPPSNAPAAPAQNNAKDADRSAEGNDETAKNLKGNVARDKAASPKSTKLNLRSSAVFKKKPTRTTEAKWVKGKAAARDAESTPEPATDAASEGDTPAQALKRAAQLVRSGYTAQAIQITLEVLREQPKNAQAYRVLGIAYSLRGSTTAACEAYRRYLRNMPEAPDRDKVQEILTACP